MHLDDNCNLIHFWGLNSIKNLILTLIPICLIIRWPLVQYQIPIPCMDGQNKRFPKGSESSDIVVFFVSLSCLVSPSFLHTAQRYIRGIKTLFLPNTNQNSKKLGFFEKAPRIWKKIFYMFWGYWINVKTSFIKIFQFFVDFSQYLNFRKSKAWNQYNFFVW